MAKTHDLRNKPRKILNLFFSFVLVCGLLPSNAFATPQASEGDVAGSETLVQDEASSAPNDVSSDEASNAPLPSDTSSSGIEETPSSSSAGGSSDSEQGDENSDLENSWRYKDGVPIIQGDEGGVSTYSSPRSGRAVVRKGIDVSEHNGNIDWDKVKASGVDFAILRIGFTHDNGRGRSDYQWERNVSECERLGIPYGVYIYSYAETASHASVEADFVLQRLKGHNPSYPVYYDLEDDCQLHVAQNHGMGSLAQTFCDKISAAGYTPGVYANTNWWTNYLTDSCFGNWEKWVAQYRNAGCTYGGSYSIWQYTDSGYVDGISGTVDMNYDYASDRKIGQYTIENRYSSTTANDSALIENGEYLIQSALASKSVIRASGNGSASESALSLYESDMNSLQKFVFEKDSATGFYRIKESKSGKYLGLTESGEMYSSSVLLKDTSSSDNPLLWKISGSNGAYIIKAAVNDGYCLDVNNASSANGTKIALYAANGNANQRFALISTSPKVDGGRTVADGVYSLSSKSDPSKVLEVEGGSSANGANVRSWSSCGAANQRFRVVMGSDGFYTLTNVQSGMALDVNAANLVPGTNVQQWEPNGGDAQKWAVVDDGDGGYVLVSKANGLVLDLSGGTAKDGTNAQCWARNGGKGQSFSFEAPAPAAVADGEYIVSTDLDPFKVLDIPNGSSADCAQVHIWESNMASWQRFSFEYDDATGYYAIRSVSSGKYLDASGGSAANGTQVIQYSATGALNQRWVVEASGQSFVIRSAVDPRFVLDVTGASSQNGSGIELYAANGNANQRFSLISPDVSPVEKSDDFGLDGWYEISPAANSSLRLDIPNASSDDGVQPLLFAANGGFNQLYKFEYTDGYYRIISACSGMVLEAKNGSVVPGVPVQQASSDGSLSQKWKAVKNQDGSYSFICAANGLSMGFSSASSGSLLVGLPGSSSAGASFFLSKRQNLLTEGIYDVVYGKDRSKVLDINGASKDDGANVQIYKSNATFNQKWKLSLVPGRENTYTFESLCSGKFLTVTDGNVVQRAYQESGENQMWVPTDLGSGSLVLENVASGKVLDVYGSHTSDGTNVQVYAKNGSDAQRFVLERTQPVKSGTYIFHSDANYGQVMDLSNSSTQDGANIASWALNYGGNQKWNVIGNGDGTYRISNAANGKVLDISGGTVSEGANVVQYAWHSGLNQKWSIEYDKNGGFLFKSALGGDYVLEVASSSPSNGSNCQIGKKNGAANQRFVLEETVYTPPVPSDRQNMADRISGYSSGTGWLIAVDRSTHRVGVFSGWAGHWSMQYYWSCVTGAPATPTITGTYRTTGFKRDALSTDSRAIYCTQIWQGYFFHSILASESELGQSLSHGCIRMAYSSAKWIHDNIYAGTTVVIYN